MGSIAGLRVVTIVNSVAIIILSIGCLLILKKIDDMSKRVEKQFVDVRVDIEDLKNRNLDLKTVIASHRKFIDNIYSRLFEGIDCTDDIDFALAFDTHFIYSMNSQWCHSKEERYAANQKLDRLIEYLGLTYQENPPEEVTSGYPRFEKKEEGE